MRGGRRLWCGVGGLLLLQGCSGLVLPFGAVAGGSLVSQAMAVPPIRGVVDFGDRAGRKLAAVMADVARGATVSLLDGNSFITLSTARTTAAGEFEIKFTGAFVPQQDVTYVLEGIKGLQENRPGNDAVRVRTFIKFNGGNWSATTQGGITINPSSTALCVMQGHYNISGVTGPEAFAQNYIGLIKATSSNPSVPDTLADGQTLINAATYAQVAGFVWESIQNDQDPVSVITYSKTTGLFAGPILDKPGIADVYPTSASTGTEITIYGVNFTGVQEVTFNGAPALPKSGSTPTKLLVDVPPDATTGPLVVRTAKGSSTGFNFSVVPGFPGRFTGAQ